MEFKSLNDAFSNNFIKSLPHLTRLDLTANEKLIIELVLSYKHNGLPFYMNYATIAEYLAINETKSKAKIVGNNIALLKKKGYITTVTTHNFNGRNGGSSTTITVNETYLEAQLHAIFNPVLAETENLPQATPLLGLDPIKLQHLEALPASVNVKTNSQTNEEFIAELEAMDDEPQPIVSVSYIANYDNSKDEVDKEFEAIAEIAMSIDDIDTFKFFLQKLLREEYMSNKKRSLLYLLDNEQDYDLELLKGAFEALILKETT